MPYIEPANRSHIETVPTPLTAGELNFILTKACLAFLYATPLVGYERLNAVVGALECCKQEFVRRMVDPYEESKKQANGDVYFED